ncbi:MAG TPA: SpoIIE family protein phosphatase [Rhodocyclaceae bacterium]|nr:SpoIIE family protein phosphatase [Rhodocyclaceae bacterium]
MNSHENAALAATQTIGLTHALITETGGLLIESPSVTPEQLNRDVFRMFEEDASLVGLPVTEQGRPIGMINRNIFMQSFARPFHREIYLQKSCIAFMDKNPLIVDKRTTIQDLSFKVIAGGDKALADGFIITDAGIYAGVGRAADMLKAVADLQAEKNRMVMESIDYASVIQRSLSRSSRESMRRALNDHFLIWEPRDVVSGDFYYFEAHEDGFLVILFDCTGHGVPGAFMTLIMSAFLQSALNQESYRNPGELIAAVNRRVKQAMGQIDHGHSELDAEPTSDDGMDAAFCWVDTKQRKLTYAGAHMPLFILRPDDTEVQIIDGDRAGVGYATTPMEQKWANHEIDLPPDTAVYFFSDGVTDQLGGNKRIAFGKRRIREVIQRHCDKSMPEQRIELMTAFSNYQGSQTRKDDVAAIGFRI